MKYVPDIYINSFWKFPFLSVTMETIHFTFVDLPEDHPVQYLEGFIHYHPFQNIDDARFLEALQIKKLAFVKSRKIDYSMDSDILNLYPSSFLPSPTSLQDQGFNWTIFALGFKFFYSLITRDLFSNVFSITFSFDASSCLMNTS